MELAKVAKKVVTVDIDQDSLRQAQHHAKCAGVDSAIEFYHGDILSKSLLKSIPQVDAAILDPVWNDQALSHMSPPEDLLFETVRKRSDHIALILPPETGQRALDLFPEHELERLYLDGELALLCLDFGKLARCKVSEFRT